MAAAPESDSARMTISNGQKRHVIRYHWKNSCQTYQLSCSLPRACVRLSLSEHRHSLDKLMPTMSRSPSRFPTILCVSVYMCFSLSLSLSLSLTRAPDRHLIKLFSKPKQAIQCSSCTSHSQCVRLPVSSASVGHRLLFACADNSKRRRYRSIGPVHRSPIDISVFTNGFFGCRRTA